QGGFCIHRSHVGRAVDENPVTVKKLFEFLQYRREPSHELAYFIECRLIEIPLEAADPPDVGRETGPANFFIDFINKLTLLQYIQKAGECTRIHAKDSVADNMVGDAREFHHDHAHILHPFRDFDAQQFFDRHVPSHVVDGRRAIVKTVGKRRDLVIGAVFGDFLERTMDVTDGGHPANDPFAIDLQDILEHPVRGGVRGPQIEGKQLILRVVVAKNRFIARYFGNRIAHHNLIFRRNSLSYLPYWDLPTDILSAWETPPC